MKTIFAAHEEKHRISILFFIIKDFDLYRASEAYQKNSCQ